MRRKFNYLDLFAGKDTFLDRFKAFDDLSASTIVISDRGNSMSRDGVIDKWLVFTKPEGTGLGLAIAGEAADRNNLN